MLKFKSFINESAKAQEYYLDDILEAADDPHKEGSVSNNTKGVLHELLTGYHLNGGKHMEKHNSEADESPKEAHDRLKNMIHPKDYEHINTKAKSAAADIKKHISSTHPNHTMHTVTWTSKPGDTEKVTGVKATQKEDASDVYVTTKHPKTGKLHHHGVSLKVSDNSSKNITTSNLGMNSAGAKAREHFASHKTAILKAYPELGGKKNKAQRKEIQQQNPDLAKNVKSMHGEMLRKVAHSQASELQHHLDTGNHEHVINHIRDVLGARNTPGQSAGHNFMKHTTYKTTKGIQHHIGDPGSDHEHILKDHKNISVKSSGTSVYFYHKGKKFAQQAHKLNSQSDPLSTLVSAGKAV
jgi:hypothetical protein